MKVEELIKEYIQTTRLKKEYDFGKRIVKSYMPYSEKCALVKSIVDTTSYEEVDGVRYYKRNSNSLLFIFTMQLISNYTDLEFANEDVAHVYDVLMESGVMNGLMSAIPEEEITILRGMLDMERDDLELNTRSLISFFETKADAFKIAMDAILEFIEKPEVQAKITEISK